MTTYKTSDLGSDKSSVCIRFRFDKDADTSGLVTIVKGTNSSHTENFRIDWNSVGSILSLTVGNYSIYSNPISSGSNIVDVRVSNSDCRIVINGDLVVSDVGPFAIDVRYIHYGYVEAINNLISEYLKTSGLIALWPLDGVKDISGNNYDLTPYAVYDTPVFKQSPLYTHGPGAVKASGAVNGLASLRSVAMPAATYFSGTKPCSFVIVSKVVNTSGSVWNQSTVDAPWQGVGYCLWLQFMTNSDYIGQRNNNDHGWVWGGTYSVGQTKLETLTFDGTNLIAYDGGTAVNSQVRNASLTYASNPIMIIGSPIYASKDDVTSSFAIFNRCLTPTEVAGLYQKYLGN